MSTEADALTQAVADSHAGAAPTNPVEQALASVHSRVGTIEAKIASIETTVNGLADVAAAVLPQAHPIVSAFQSIEDLINRILAGFETHFQGKIALPAPTDGAITASLTPAASNLSTNDAGKVRLGAMSPSLPA